MGSKSSTERIEVPESFVTGFHGDRKLYFWIILIVSVIAVIGNILAIRSVLFKKLKYLQKTCVISLALSDLMTVILFAMNYLDLLSKHLVTWSYGEFLCHYLPVGQVLGNLASSAALLVIALDRYHNVIHALSKKWDPSLWKCLAGAVILWILCAGCSYPVVTFYIYFLIRVNDIDDGMCYAAQQDRNMIMIYYIAMNVLFFFPIISLFFWFYYKIAMLIWRHRKPLTENSNQDVTESSTGKVMQDSSTPPMKFIVKKKNIQMERKKRSFKIVLTLIFAFVGCRLPYWLFMVYKLVITCASDDVIWKTSFIFTALNLLNCALNPFLYTYLNITLNFFRKMNDFICKICCCCFSNTEFEDFETGKPIAEGIMGYKENVRDDKENPRNGNKPKVQFLNVAVIPKYIQKEIN